MVRCICFVFMLICWSSLIFNQSCTKYVNEGGCGRCHLLACDVWTEMGVLDVFDSEVRGRDIVCLGLQSIREMGVGSLYT